VTAKQLEVSIDSKHMLSSGAKRRWLYKMVIETANVNPSRQLDVQWHVLALVRLTHIP